MLTGILNKPILIGRTIEDVIGDLIVSIQGGVVNESHTFANGEFDYPLRRILDQNRGVSSVTGFVHDNNQERPNRFIEGTDYQVVLGDEGSASLIRWSQESDAVHPLPGRLFAVDYFPINAESPVTDLAVGSVARTLCEAYGREGATLFAALEEVYRSAFIDFAEGRSLDFVVSLLDVSRRVNGFHGTDVEFSRASGVEGAIALPSGIRLLTNDGVLFETTEFRMMANGQDEVSVPARATVAGDEGAADADAISSLATPLAGIESVGNKQPTRIGPPESDDALRQRSKAKIRRVNSCTVPAIKETIRKLLDPQDDFQLRDPMMPKEKPVEQTQPGTLSVIINETPEKLDNVRSVLETSRAAGVFADVIAAEVVIEPGLSLLKTPANPDKTKQGIVDALCGFIGQLKPGEVVKGIDLLESAAEALGLDPKGLLTYLRLEKLLARYRLPDSAPFGQFLPGTDLIKPVPPESETEIPNWQFRIETQIEGVNAKPTLLMTASDIQDKSPAATYVT